MTGETIDPINGVTLPDASPILTMHAQYERAWLALGAVEDARPPGNAKDDDGTRYALDRAMNLIGSEIDALRTAILMQVPVSWQDALVLTYHIHVAHELEDKPTEESKVAFRTAIDTLFDFMCCEVRQDHERLGKQFQTSANLVFTARRLRTGIVEDL